MKLDRHPLSALGGDIPEAQFQELCADIEAHGQRFAITVYDSTVLDGWHRYKACDHIKVKPKIEKFKGTPQEAAEFAISVNAHRRNQSDSQRAFFITGCFQWAEGSKKGRGGEPGSPPSSKTNREMAGLAETSSRTIQQAKRVHEAGSKALKEAVRTGEVSIKKAAAVVDLPKSEQLAEATKKAEPPKPTDPIVATDWTPEIPDDEELAAIDREIQESESRILRADDTATGYHDEIKRQAAEIATLKITRDGYMNGKAAITKLLIAEQRKVMKLEKEIEKLRNENEGLRERVSIMEAA